MTMERLKKYRRDLHQIPELGFEVHKTRQYILDHLKQYDCEITEVCGGVCAFFSSRTEHGSGSPRENTIALRSDMDALPVAEKTGASYCSLHGGVMHACGHDGHMAMLLAMADELSSSIHTLSHNVLLIFQPAEETTGGAGDMVAAGILSKYNVKRIYGFHLWPMLEKHRIGSRAREFMAKSSEIDIKILGKSAHCAYPEQGVDALAIGCELINELYQMEKNELAQEVFRLLKFGKMTSGTVRNAIAAETVLEGTLRCFSEETGTFLSNRMTEISAALEQKYGCKISFHRTDGHPPVINDSNLFEEAKDLLSKFNFHTFEVPFMLSEDFSFYQRAVPGLFLFLGTGTNIPLHNNLFDFDEEVLQTGVDAYRRILTAVTLQHKEIRRKQMQIGKSNLVTQNRIFSGADKKGNIGLPTYTGFHFNTKTAPTMSDDKYKAAIIEQAKKDQAAGKFQTDSIGYKSLVKSYVSSVSPDRKNIIAKGLTAVFETNKPEPKILTLLDYLFGSVKYTKESNNVSYAEFYDSNGEMVATYSNTGWTFYGTKAENARESELRGIYNQAWNSAAKASQESSGTACMTILA